MGFIVDEYDRRYREHYTRLINTITGPIPIKFFPPTTNKYLLEEERLSEYREVLSADAIGIYGKQIDIKMGVGSLILEHTLETVKSRFADQEKHMEYVERFSIEMGKILHVTGNDLKELALAAKLHDVGKAFIEPGILNKPRRLTPEEMIEVKKHPEIGYWLLKADKRYRKLAKYVRYHHERWDGLGYPGGLKGGEIPLFSRIIAVADAYDAMTSDRVYQKTKTREEAVREIIDHAGSQFDPKIAKIFVEKVLLRFPINAT